MKIYGNYSVLLVNWDLTGCSPSVTLRVTAFQGSADPFSLKMLHWSIFRALEPSKREPFGAPPYRLPLRGSCRAQRD